MYLKSQILKQLGRKDKKGLKSMLTSLEACFRKLYIKKKKNFCDRSFQMGTKLTSHFSEVTEKQQVFFGPKTLFLDSHIANLS